MPFELGMDYACKLYGGKILKQKKCLVLEVERYRYQAAISDLSGCDIKAHGNKPDMVVLHVRNWLVQHDLGKGPSATDIWYGFNDFMAYNFAWLTSHRFSKKDIDTLPINELMDQMRKWIKANVKK